MGWFDDLMSGMRGGTVIGPPSQADSDSRLIAQRNQELARALRSEDDTDEERARLREQQVQDHLRRGGFDSTIPPDRDYTDMPKGTYAKSDGSEAERGKFAAGVPKHLWITPDNPAPEFSPEALGIEKATIPTNVGAFPIGARGQGLGWPLQYHQPVTSGPRAKRLKDDEGNDIPSDTRDDTSGKAAFGKPEAFKRRAEAVAPSGRYGNSLFLDAANSKLARIATGRMSMEEAEKGGALSAMFDLSVAGPGAKAATLTANARRPAMTAAAVKAAADRAAARSEGRLPKVVGDAKTHVDDIMLSPAVTEKATGPEIGAALRGGIGHNEPPLPGEWRAPQLDPVKVKSMAELPDVRRLGPDEASRIAANEPHLVKSGEKAEGLYVGAPRNIRSRRALEARRRAVDDYIAQNPEGGPWYNRAREGFMLTTRGIPEQTHMQAGLHGQTSAGVDPGTETAMSIRLNNMALRHGGVIPQGKGAGFARPDTRKALQRAIDLNDPKQMARGLKTSEYAGKLDPFSDFDRLGKTGVNDYRNYKLWDYRNLDNSEFTASKRLSGQGPSQKWLDYETVLAVDRANKVGLGGRNDWTGEQIQAAPWVHQKALELQAASPKGKDGKPTMTYDEAFALANRSFTDFIPRHTFNATFEQMPGAASGHMPGLQAADKKTKDAFARHKGSSEMTDDGYDKLYSSLVLKRAPGIAMQQQKSVPMQGVYTTKDAAGNPQTEFNPGEVARPLVSIMNTPGGKKITPGDRSILETVEAFRALMNMNEMGAGHIVFQDPKALKEIKGVNVPLEGPPNSLNIPMGRMPTLAETRKLQKAGSKFDLGDLAHRGNAPGSGFTMTNFDDDTRPAGEKIREALKAGLANDIKKITGTEPEAVGTDSIAHFWTDQMKKGVGSGAMTDRMIEMFTKEPNIAQMLNESPYVPGMAKAKMERDAEFAAKLNDTVRVDIQNLRKIISEGPNWLERVVQARIDGKILLPSIVLPMLGLSATLGTDPSASPGSDSEL